MKETSLNIAKLVAATDDTHTPADVDATYRKILFRLLPLLIVCYVCAYLDRVNISFAKLQFMSDLGFSEAAYGLGAGLFFLGYVLFEVPSNLLMQRIGARRTLLRIMVTWGVISSATMFVKTPMQFYVLRVLLGVAEAGFFPGVLFYLTIWFPSARRGRVTGYLMASTALAGIIGGPVSAWIMVHMAGLLGLKGWQWLLLAEGLPSLLLGALAFLILSDRPADARWLSDKEKAIVLGQLRADEGSSARGHAAGHAILKVLGQPRIYVAIVAYFCVIMPFNAIGFWTPTILKDMGIKNLIHVGWLSSLVFIAAAMGTWILGASSDHFKERRWHLLISSAVMAVCFGMLPLALHSQGIAIAMLGVAAAASYGAFVVFWTIPPSFLDGDAKAGGIALITSIGGTGAFVSPTLVGWIKTSTGSLYPALTALGVIAVAGAILMMMTVRPASPGART
ncbi:MFS transporter [Paraburkholderia sacchari]|uniref:MFS transporter n=1 Tax=Paraburkholderia sacchari TaxID=159450 RepID=A0A8T6ZE61_9BURK|nr:MFS transporter [Paraburkholderia sacchari]